MPYKTAVPDSQGRYVVFGEFGKYGRGPDKLKPRRWIATPRTNVEKLEADTILDLRCAGGGTDEVFAGDPGVQFDRKLIRH